MVSRKRKGQEVQLRLNDSSGWDLHYHSRSVWNSGEQNEDARATWDTPKS